MIELYEVPRDIEPEEIPWDGMQTLLLGAIVNPMGPTFFGVATSEHVGELLFFSFNPFAHTVQCVGTLDSPVLTSSDFAQLHPIFEGVSPPTFMGVSKELDPNVRKEVQEAWFRSFDGAAETASLAIKYMGDPWTRVSKEMEQAFESIKPLGRGMFGFLRRRQEWAGDPIADFIKASASASHLKPELKAFFFAWNGAIEHTSPALARDAMKVELAIELFLIFSSSCALPAEIWEK